MKVRARARMHATSGWDMSSGADWDVRPDTRVLGPRERDMNEEAKSGDLSRLVVSGWVGRKGERRREGEKGKGNAPDADERRSFVE